MLIVYLLLFVGALFSVKAMADAFIPKISVLEYQAQLEEISEFGTR
jgi:hypothetical protein